MNGSAQQERWINGAAVSVAFASVLALDPGGWFPFSIAKWPAVLVCALVAGASLIWSGPPAIERRVGWAWAALLVATAVSAVVGLDGRMAWFGTPVRHLGALTWAVFAMVFIVGTHMGSSPMSVRSLVRGLVLAGGALGAYTVWEIVADGPVDYVSDSSRAGGTYGSAAYLGAACCLFLPVAVGLAGSASAARRWRVGAAVVALLLVTATLGSGTRGAVVALVATGLVVVVCRSRSSPRRRPILLGVGTLTVVVASIAATTEQFRRSAPVGSRVDEWLLGVSALRDRPLLGYGPEGYRLVVDRFLTPDYVRSYGDSVLPDRAHNAVLDVALSSGVVAAFGYVVLLIAVVVAGVRMVGRGSPTQAGLGAATIAFVLQQQFLFPIAEIDTVFWLVAGVTVAASHGVDQEPGTAMPSGQSGAELFRKPMVRRSVAVGLVGLAIVTAVGGVRSVAADRLVRSATEPGAVEQAVSDAERAVALDAHDIRLRVVLARSYERRQTLRGVDAAIEAVEDARMISPLDPTVLREQARLASLRASITGAEPDRERATALWKSMVGDAPNCMSCLRSLGLTLREAGDDAEAMAALERAALLGDELAAALLTRPQPSRSAD